MNARKVLECLRSRGAMFFNDLRAMTGLDADDTRSGIGALVASGLAASDGFSGLRALLVNVPGRAWCATGGRHSPGDGAPSLRRLRMPSAAPP